MKQETRAAAFRRSMLLALAACLALLAWGIFATTVRTPPTPRGPIQAPMQQLPVERGAPAGETFPAS